MHRLGKGRGGSGEYKMSSSGGELAPHSFTSCAFQVSTFEMVERGPQLTNHSPPQLMASPLKQCGSEEPGVLDRGRLWKVGCSLTGFPDLAERCVCGWEIPKLIIHQVMVTDVSAQHDSERAALESISL